MIKMLLMLLLLVILMLLMLMMLSNLLMVAVYGGHLSDHGAIRATAVTVAIVNVRGRVA